VRSLFSAQERLALFFCRNNYYWWQLQRQLSTQTRRDLCVICLCSGKQQWARGELCVTASIGQAFHGTGLTELVNSKGIPIRVHMQTLPHTRADGFGTFKHALVHKQCYSMYCRWLVHSSMHMHANSATACTADYSMHYHRPRTWRQPQFGTWRSSGMQYGRGQWPARKSVKTIANVLTTLYVHKLPQLFWLRCMTINYRDNFNYIVCPQIITTALTTLYVHKLPRLF
jgi:hypothetical protein